NEFFKGDYTGIDRGGHYSSLLKIGTTLSLVRFKESKTNNTSTYGELEQITKVTKEHGQVSNTNGDKYIKTKTRSWLNNSKGIVICNGYFTCPYKEECHTFKAFGGLTQMLKTNFEKEYEYDLCLEGMELNEARGKFNLDFNKALNSNIKYHNFTAPTGIGKTHTIINTIKPKEKEVFIIVAPTHKLIQEEYSNFPHTKENIELPKKYKLLHLLGYKNNKKVSNKDKCILEEYHKISKENNHTLLNNPVVVTTHKMFALVGEKIVNELRAQEKEVTVIIDEDITDEYINIDSLSADKFNTNINNLIRDLKFSSIFKIRKEPNKYIKQDIDNKSKELIKKLKRIRKRATDQRDFYNIFDLSTTDKEQIKELVKLIKSEDYDIEFIKHILKGQLRFFFSYRGDICLINQEELPQDVKYIFLSATPNRIGLDMLTKSYVRCDYDYSIKTTTTVLQLNQNTSKTKVVEGLKEEVITKIRSLITRPDETLLVTFQDTHEQLKEILGVKHSLYFGNVKGYNEFSGMDIMVVGTP
ncbi:DEAD/DEAH box helicase family protein, partial [Romboutsia sp.]|uniref:DEAD/DEAH box helicase family protein n=1 Tax=Romboutsia sp. TaxID=1965302 RepID=UPI002CE226C7